MSAITPDAVHAIIDKHLIADGFATVFDLERSHGSWIVDAVSGREHLDFYGFFASLPLGFNHPTFEQPDNRQQLFRAALHKPANSDAESVQLAEFVDGFAREAMPPPFKHLFFVEGGALAVENALKTAFDWKVRKNLAAGRGELGSRVVHFRQAFHGRSGYTLSLTNTLPIKVDYFPKFAWPRIDNPKLRFPLTIEETERVKGEEDKAIAQIERAFDDYADDIAAIIIEPIQGEGGDNHFRGEFLRRLREVADRRDAMLIFDEVQTGFGGTGRLWAWQHFDVVPDILCFGKKTQVCGIMAGPRVDQVRDNVFAVSSRINSTWGGGLVDMVRCRIVLEEMKRSRLVENAASVGDHLLQRLVELSEEFPDEVKSPRGRGLMCAFDCRDQERRNAVHRAARSHGLYILPCGPNSLRFRPALTVGIAEVDEAHQRLRAALATPG